MKRQKGKIPDNKNYKKDNKTFNTSLQKTEISKKMLWLWISAIFVLIFVVFSPAYKAELTSWDDDRYIEKNPYLKDLSIENIKTLFSTDTYYMGNYHPLAMLSLSVDYAIAGDDGKGGFNPFIFHFVNIFIHLIVSLLVFYFVYLLFRNINIAGFVGVLFAVHTLHVESIAWVSERKDVLYALFFVASLIFYLRYIDSDKKKFYIISFLLFLLSLFSKGQAVSLSVTLFALDFLRGRKLLDKKVILEKIPYLILAVIFGLIAIKAQAQSEAIVDKDAYNFFQRIIIASYAFTTYIIKLILPINLSAINPYPDIIHKTLPAYYGLYLIPSGLVVFLFFKFLKKNKEISFAIAFFIINIFLLLQFIPVGSAIYADRYAYISSIGFFILLGILLNKMVEKRLEVKKTLFFTSVVYIVILSFLTFNRTKVWESSLSLWENTVEKSPRAVVAWNNLGSYNEKKAKSLAEENLEQESYKYRKKAIECFTKAIEQKPDYSSAYYNRGVSQYEYSKLTGDTISMQRSVDDFGNAIAYKNLFADAYHYRANAKSELKRYNEAMLDFDLAISMDSSKSLFYVNRGITKGKMFLLNEAIKDFNKAELIEPNNESIYSNRGLAKAMTGNYKEAILDYNKAISLKKDFYTAYYNRAISKQKLKMYEESIKDLDFVLNNKSNFTDAYNIRAFCYEQLGFKEKACEDYTESAKQGNAFAVRRIKEYCK